MKERIASLIVEIEERINLARQLKSIKAFFTPKDVRELNDVKALQEAVEITADRIMFLD